MELELTEGEQLEMALLESEQRYKRLLTATSDYVYSVQLQARQSQETVHGPGCEAVTGYTSGEFSSDPYLWYRVIHEEDRAAVLAQVDRLLKGEQPQPLEHRLRHKDGSYRWILARAVVLRDAPGKPLRMAGSHVDLTERINAAQRLEQANASLAKRSQALKKIIQKLKASHRELKETQWQLIQAAKFESAGILAAGVAHEVKNPLQTILMGVDHLAAKLPATDEDLAVTMADMRNAVQRATNIIRELLSLSAAADFQLRAEDVNALLERSLLLVQTELSAAQITFVRNLPTNLPRVSCDNAKIQQVFLNLFINAIQAMPQGGTLTLSTRTLAPSDETLACREILRKFQPTERLVAIEIQDTGGGIAEEHFPRLFDPFFTTKPVGVGTGLGLSVTKRIVDLHGGALAIKNAALRGVLATIILKS